MYNTHTLYYLQKHKLVLDGHNHHHSPRVHKCDSLFDFSSSMHTLSKLLLLHHSFTFLSLCVSLSFLTLHLYYMVMLCSVHIMSQGSYWVYIGVHCFLIPPEVTAVWIDVTQSDLTCFASLHSNCKSFLLNQ